MTALRPALPRSPDHLDLVVARVAVGDADALRELYEATASWVFSIADRTLRATEHADEVVQEVFLQVWQQASTFDPGRGSVHGWLAVLAHRRAVDRVRQLTRARVRDQRAFDLDEATVPDVAEAGLARVEADRVRAALHRLTHEQREALALTFLAGCTHVQAAGLLAIPVGTLKSRVRAGLIRLRSLLEVTPAPMATP